MFIFLSYSGFRIDDRIFHLAGCYNAGVVVVMVEVSYLPLEVLEDWVGFFGQQEVAEPLYVSALVCVRVTLLAASEVE